MIDDFIPTHSDSSYRLGVPLASRCVDNDEVWVMLIEKAFAKAHGCYEALAQGLLYPQR